MHFLSFSHAICLILDAEVEGGEVPEPAEAEGEVDQEVEAEKAEEEAMEGIAAGVPEG